MSDFDPAQLNVIHYPHPTLRIEAQPIRRVDAMLKQIVARMFELMYEHRGVGLAATQVNLPLRLFVMNPTGNPTEGPESAILNPVVSRPRSNEEAEEGCLSLPNIHGNVVRAKTIRLNGFDMSGREIDQDFSGFEARVIQHEVDHLNGTLFIDRVKEGSESEFAHELDTLETEFRSRQRTESMADDNQLLAQLSVWIERYC